MKATELVANQLQIVHQRVLALKDFSTAEWMARPGPGRNRVGFTAWHMVATRDWVIRPILQAKRPVGWDAPFAGSGIAQCAIAFGMPFEEADEIAETVSPPEVARYSEAVMEEFLGWLRAADDSALDAPPPRGREHLAFSPRYSDAEYRRELDESPTPMTDWPTWQLLTRPAFGHCLYHFEEMEFAKANIGLY